MQRRTLFAGLLAAAFAAVAAACSDDTPTLPGGFPPDAVPVTREVLVPAGEFLQVLGTYRGYTRASQAGYLTVAENYEGLYAHALARFGTLPRTVSYVRDGNPRTDSLFALSNGRLVVKVDTLSSTDRPFTLRIYQAGQAWVSGSATWTTAIDTGSVETPWTQPGGTRGAFLGEATLGASPSTDSLVFALPEAALRALTDTASNGLLVEGGQAGSRVQITSLVLRANAKPDSARPDTSIAITVSGGAGTTIYTPEPPTVAAGDLAAGGVLGARTLLDLDLAQTVPDCAAGEACGEVPLSQVQLNIVQLILRPRDVPGGYDPLGGLPLTLRRVSEPELGYFAPLGAVVTDGAAAYLRGDSLAVIPLTNLALQMSLNDSLPTTFALTSESGSGPPTFGMGLFDSEPRLRIVYTLPARRPLP